MKTAHDAAMTADLYSVSSLILDMQSLEILGRYTPHSNRTCSQQSMSDFERRRPPHSQVRLNVHTHNTDRCVC